MATNQPNNPLRDKNLRRGPRFNPLWVFLSLIALLIVAQLFRPTQRTKELSWDSFREAAAEGAFRKFEVNRQSNTLLAEPVPEKLSLILDKKEMRELLNKPESTDRWLNPFPTVEEPTLVVVVELPSVDAFSSYYDEAGLKTEVRYVTKRSFWREILINVLPLLLIIVFWVVIFRRMNAAAGKNGGPGGIFNVGKSKAKLFDRNRERVNVTFADVAGLHEAKQELEEIVHFLKDPSKYTALGGKIPKGALLVGPPGTGKTLLAKAVAGEAHVDFFSMSGSDFVEMFVGVGASRVRDLFQQAKEKTPCIVFIDEIDAVGRARGKNVNMGGNDERENTLNQLLTEMDGFDSNSGVIVLAATNRADVLDSALLRAGRFDRQIQVDLPDLNDRVEIFGVHMKKLRLAPTVDVEQLSRQTPGFSGADIANVCNEAALIAARYNKDMIEMQDFHSAVDRIIGGLEKKNRITTEEERRNIAIHEAGHATVTWKLQYGNPLVKVTIVQRGKALGAAWYMPEERQMIHTQVLLDEICGLLGGRAAEELFLGHISTGAANDLERVTKMAYAMVLYYGMSEALPNISYYDAKDQYGFQKPYSEKTSELIDQEVKQLIATQYERAKALLTEHRAGHNQIAELLLEREVIFTEDVERILGARPWKSRSDQLLDDDRKRKAQGPPPLPASEVSGGGDLRESSGYVVGQSPEADTDKEANETEEHSDEP